MNENRQTCKSFDRGPDFELSALPPLLAGLLEGHQVYTHLGEADLREMSKFGEIPNLNGLAAHPIRYPAPAGLDLGLKPSVGHHGQEPLAISPQPLLPGGVRKALARQLVGIPSLVIRGTLAGASAFPFAVQVIVPQTHAHLAVAVQKMLWPLADSASPEQMQPEVQYTLFHWPEPIMKKTGEVVVGEFVAHWAEARLGSEGLGVVIGFDDPRLMERMLLDAARRHWESLDDGPRLILAGEESFSVEGQDQARQGIPEPLLIEEGEEEGKWGESGLAQSAGAGGIARAGSCRARGRTGAGVASLGRSGG